VLAVGAGCGRQSGMAALLPVLILGRPQLPARLEADPSLHAPASCGNAGLEANLLFFEDKKKKRKKEKEAAYV